MTRSTPLVTLCLCTGLLAACNMDRQATTTQPKAPPPAASLPRSSGQPANLHFPGIGSFPASLDQDILGRLQHSLARVALQKGGRR